MKTTMHQRPGSQLRVVLIDDDDALRRLLSRMLRANGFEVQEFANAEHAVTAVETNPMDFDVLVTDSVMPGLSGPEAAQRIVAAAPQIAIVLMSGYREQDVAGAIRGHECYRFLQKPFLPGDFAATVRQAALAAEMVAAA